MGTSTIYKFPWPELPEPADGPDGFKDLATSVDLDMTQWRREQNTGWGDHGYVYQPNPDATPRPQDIWYNWYPVVKGWTEIDVSTSWLPQGGCVQGTVSALFNDVVARQWVVHNDCQGTDVMMFASGTVAQEFAAGSPEVKFSLTVDVAYSGSPLMLVTTNIMVRQFGART